ncbi:TonB-dependent receptor domain-containing protein [Novosphingobium album (ex Liu et al. 2023)]|uniref:TonB-dependent receptor n=1 Tax=Novosphingobium album (ex Liu et al. 2023) TaxID=3031130 RepID=A0ABT5WS88_9SPHN|nr:TonB-dependent receptor [Novosphingobium album (ex Liu et al. 2023)]MDE8652897.1 TonB-dependent receptor [Novosphingobium album (ex Liu et al. 2023)]
MKLQYALGAASAVVAVCTAQPALAQARLFDIPAQSAVTGIPAFARQAGVQIVAPAGGLDGKRTRAVKGRLAVDQALAHLLQGTGLRVGARNGQTISLVADTTSDARFSDTALAEREAQAEIIVTGTRVAGMRAADSPTPIQVIDQNQLKRTGQPDMIQSLAQNLPTVQVQAFGSDLQAATQQMRLRGLSPNHTLVLLNGKRRHGTANVAVAGGVFNGGAAPDVSFILPDSIDRVEVLQDGAAAQYGTDAIAGVINFIQKKADHGGTINATAGQYFDEGGETYSVSGNIGIAPFENAYLNLTAENKRHDYSFRGDVNPLVYGPSAVAQRYLSTYPAIAQMPDYPYVNKRLGDPQSKQTTVNFNGGYDFGDVELYTFGSWAHKIVRARQNYRPPDVVTSANGTPLFPGGFAPVLRGDDTDYSFSAGLKGNLGGTTFDIASTYGRDEFAVYVEKSANASLYKDKGFTPDTFYDGTFTASQWSNTLDLTHEFDLGLASPLTVAGGLEWRRETYGIGQGDPASYYASGAQAFIGYGPNNAGGHHRTNFSQYLDLAVKPVDGWLVEGAVRHERYSDFGDTTALKLTTRLDLSSAFAVRGTISTGFRAPTLGESFYSGVNVGTVGVSGLFPPGSNAAVSLGFGGLKPEKSTSYNLGFVFKPARNLSITIDGYWTTIRDRIVMSGSYYGYLGNACPEGYKESGAFDANRCGVYNADTYAIYNQQAVLDAVAASLGGEIPSYILKNLAGTRNVDGAVSIQTFVNGMDTRNRGIDLMVNYKTDLGSLGGIDWSLAANYNELKVTKVGAPPSKLYQSTINPAATALMNKYSIWSWENSFPKFRAVLNAFWTMGDFSLNLRENYYSSQSTLTSISGVDFVYKNHAAFITDLEAAYQLTRNVKVAIGANNLTNHYPSKLPYDKIRKNQYLTGDRGYSWNGYLTDGSFGINGGYYYGRLTLTF